MEEEEGDHTVEESDQTEEESDQTEEESDKTEEESSADEMEKWKKAKIAAAKERRKQKLERLKEDNEHSILKRKGNPDK